MESVCHGRHNFALQQIMSAMTNRLQSKQVDIASAHSHATNVIETMKALKSAAEDGFGKALFLTHTAKNRYRVRTRGSPNSETDNVTAGRY